MTNLTDGQLKHCDKRIVEAFNKFISGEFSVALERIKSLEDTILKLQGVVNDQKVVIDGQATEIVNLKEKEPQMDPENAWNLIDKNPAVKSGIMNMVAIERKSCFVPFHISSLDCVFLIVNHLQRMGIRPKESGQQNLKLNLLVL